MLKDKTVAVVLGRDGARYHVVDLGREDLAVQVQTLRCGLDEEEWATPTNAGRCANLLGLTEKPDESRPLPFDLGRAHTLYKALFGQSEEMIAGKRLIIVPSGPLTSLPFHVLVTKAPEAALPQTFPGYRDVAWLGRSHAVIALPAVSSLKALRQNVGNRPAAAGDYAGYGNPVLQGDSASCRLAKVPEQCPTIEVDQLQPVSSITAKQTGEPQRATIRGRRGRRSAKVTTDDVFSKGATMEAVAEQVRGLCPLPDTAYEIKCVGERFKEQARLIRLDREARESHHASLCELDSNPKAGRAEALQQAMIALIDDTSQADNAHPAVWAPFVVVGEGGREIVGSA